MSDRPARRQLIVDTTTLIDADRGVGEARVFLSDYSEQDRICLHPISAMELVSGARDRAHLREIRRIIDGIPLLAVRNSDFLRTLDLLYEHALATRAGFADWILAASALRLGLTVATANVKHFRAIRGLKMMTPY